MYEVYIYKNEARISGPGIDLRFKAKDCGSPDRLVNDFVQKIMSLLSR